MREGAHGKTLGGGVAVAIKQFQRSGHAARNRSNRKEKKDSKRQKQRSGMYFSVEIQYTLATFFPRTYRAVKAKVERFNPY
jgi:hypothetical protein